MRPARRAAIRPWLWLLLVGALVLSLAACGQDTSVDGESSSEEGAPPPLVVPSEPGLQCDWAKVLDIVDGDTIHALVDGRDESIRLIGVDAPELHHPTRGEEPFGREAMQYVDDAVEGWVCLESDITDRDQFGRLLRYAWLPDTRLLNEALVAAGLAQRQYVPTRRSPPRRPLSPRAGQGPGCRSRHLVRLRGRSMRSRLPRCLHPAKAARPRLLGHCVPQVQGLAAGSTKLRRRRKRRGLRGRVGEVSPRPSPWHWRRRA